MQHVLAEEDRRPIELTMSYSTEGQERPEESLSTAGSGDPGPVGGGRRTPPPKQPRIRKSLTWKPLSPNTRRAIFNTRREDLEPIEAEPKGEEVWVWV